MISSPWIDLGWGLIAALIPLWGAGPLWLYGVTVAYLCYKSREPSQPDRESGAKKPPAFLLVPIFWVSLCFVAVPDLSDDYHRYLWEGFVQNQGFSPYAHEPRSLYAQLDHPSEGLVNHDHLATIYPPLALYLFRLADGLSPSIYAWKLLLLLSLLPLLYFRHLPRSLLFCSPLILVEGLWNAHLDVLGVVPGFLLVAALEKQKPRTAAWALALLTLLKLLPALLFPFIFFHFKGRRRWWFAGLFAVLVGAAYLPFFGDGPLLFASFVKFSREWYFNNPWFHLLLPLLGNGGSRLVLGLLLAGVYLTLLFRREGVIFKAICLWTALICLSPTVYPWYLIWLLPWITGKNRFVLHCIYGACCLSYLVLIPYRQTGVWQESWWWLAPEWILMTYGFVVLLLAEKKRDKAGCAAALSGTGPAAEAQ